MRLLHALLAWLDRGGGVAKVLLVGLILVLPSLGSPLFSDDWMQARKLDPEAHGEPLPFGDAGLNDAFVFATGDAEVTREAMEQGYFAWWAAPDVKLAFWRPLSTLSHALDHTLWPHSSVLMHLHSLAWHALLLGALVFVYRRFLGPRAGLLALALFAWDDARGFVLSMIANRNALLATLAGVGVLWLHDRWRRDGWRPGLVLALPVLLLGLLSAELALATTAYLFAYALFLDRGSWVARLGSLVPYGLVVLGWTAVYRSLGYGVTGSGVYVHPLDSPAFFVQRLAERAPVLALGQLGLASSDAAIALPRQLVTALGAIGLVAVFALGAIGWRTLRARPEARFLALGALISLLPISAAFTSDRNLSFVGFGASGLVALVLLDLKAVSPAEHPRWRRVGGFLLVAVHLFFAPLLLPVRSLSTLVLNAAFDGIFAPLEEVADLEDKTLVVVWSGSDGPLGFGRVHQVARGEPMPGGQLQLVASEGPVTIERVGPRSLRLEAEGFLAHESQQMVRGPMRPFAVGDEVVLTELTVTVEEITSEGRPLAIRADFVADLDDPRWLWRWESWGVLQDWEPPEMGESWTGGGLY